MLSPGQERVYDALSRLTADGWPASVREVAAVAERGVQTVHGHLTDLVLAGVVERHPRNPRLGFRTKRA